MRYLLLIYSETPTAEPSAEEIQAEMDAYASFTADIAQSGVLLAGEALEGPDTATSVRVRDGQTMTTDGPFAETKEWLGGYYLVDCKDLDEAIEWAAKIPGARNGTVEVRPVWEMPAEYAGTADAMRQAT